MTEPLTMALLASFGLVALGLALLATLKGWQGWLDLKRLELAGRARDVATATPAERIEIADLRERVRKLEAIASCVDL
jgi:hypothetical protein